MRCARGKLLRRAVKATRVPWRKGNVVRYQRAEFVCHRISHDQLQFTSRPRIVAFAFGLFGLFE